jgi:Trk K+ transport system NAD-binding subunit
MGQLLTNPRLNEFVEIIADRNISFDLVGVPVSKESPWAGKTLLETDLRSRGIMVVAVRHKDGTVDLAPAGMTMLTEGDELFALGNTEAIHELR